MYMYFTYTIKYMYLTGEFEVHAIWALIAVQVSAVLGNLLPVQLQSVKQRAARRGIRERERERRTVYTRSREGRGSGREGEKDGVHKEQRGEGIRERERRTVYTRSREGRESGREGEMVYTYV